MTSDGNNGTANQAENAAHYVAPQLKVIDLADVTITRGDRNILDQINWQVNSNQRWVIMGPNGAGKTTLMQVCTGYLHPTSGTVEVLDQKLGQTDVRELQTRIGLSSATISAALPPAETVFNSVLTAAYAVSGRWRERYDDVDYQRVNELLADWGLTQLAQRTVGTLSEGERKRVLIARALMTDPEILILDEPAAGLDVAGREDLVARLARLASDELSPCLILVTHHVEEIPPNFTHALLISDGKISTQGSIHEVIASEPMSHAFKTPLLVEFGEDRWYARGEVPSKGRRAKRSN